ncbi:MAG: hypothetical protein KGP29_08060 [Proteobacteria bacterium]|nr:hypothetical protein [Pseudomonadota bacterium]
MKVVVLVFGIFLSLNCFAKDDHLISQKRVSNHIKGKWVSISCELRPRENRGSGGTVESFWLKREFVFDGKDGFKGIIKGYADPLCEIPVQDFEFEGHLIWRGPHPVAKEAQSVDYELSKEFAIIPRSQAAVDQMNSLPVGACGDKKYELNVRQSIFKKPCALFNIKSGEVVKDHDLIYLYGFNNPRKKVRSVYLARVLWTDPPTGRGFDYAA